MAQLQLSFAGAGRVAEALCLEMYNRGFKILQIVSESSSGGKSLASKCNASWSSALNFEDNNDLIIVAVPDSRLKEVLSGIACPENSIVVHTAGSYGLDIFPSRIKNKGVFYPLQTFTKGRKINFTELPFLIETSLPETGDILKTIAASLGSKVFFAGAEKRRMLHLAAVFVCNFTNHMLTAGKEIAAQGDMPFDLLEPLITETIHKAIENGPEFSQTGPAVRKDMNTINMHLDLLSFSPELKEIYNVVTSSIINHYKKES